jgi:hypothetical protein
MSALQFSSVLVCDDIRKEVSNKDILIGVYSGDIVVPSFPVWLPISFWIEVSANEAGKSEAQFRLTVVDHTPPIMLKAGLQVDKPGSTAIIIAGLQLLFEKEGDLILEVKPDGGDWTVLKSKKIMQGELPASASSFPTLTSRPPSDAGSITGV